MPITPPIDRDAGYKNRVIIFFDGPCSFCNTFIRFVFKHDAAGCFVFSPLQSGFAAKMLGAPLSLKTILVKDGERVYKRSGAVIFILSRLGFPYNLAKLFLLIPRFLRDAVYNFIAALRHKFSSNRSCLLSQSPGLEAKIIK